MAIDPVNLELPREPGVYLFKNKSKKVLYVGKATEIKTRVKSYFSSNPDRLMIPKLIEKSDHIDYIVTNNPDEALILERELIRKFKPRYNSMLKDDRSYPLIALTNEEFPRIMYTRNPPKDSRIWGPFPNVSAVKQVIQLLRKQFGIRDKDCRGKDGCLSMQIGLCRGPCLDPEGYPEIVKIVTNVLDGKAEQLLNKLTKNMEKHSQKMEFENAGKQRDMIRAIQSTLSQRIITSRFYRDCDAIGFAKRGNLVVVTVLHAKSGTVQGQQTWPLIHRGDVEDTICRFISEFYSTNRPPSLILLPCNISQFLSEWLFQRRGTKVELRVPKRGKLLELKNLADKNAELQIEREQWSSSGSLEQRAVNECADYLGMDSLDHIVCFDMAQLQGKNRVGASISLKSGRPEKSSYRKYKVKGKQLDDIRMMLEVLERWLKNQKTWPNLLLIDGGETHLKFVYELLKEHELEETILIAALAKKEEILFRINSEPVILDKRGRVLIFARDEAHRFVNRFHRKSRQSNLLKDPLESIEGLGAKKIQALLRYFGGRQGLLHASVNDISKVPGIGKSLAKRIVDGLSK
ncbi:MAG TPA: excinuclease ABC subunit UvrC [Candidatus Poseidoniaceae archaeon]|nr:excinuclease ABC subunit UvrC [Candidatus Poseidoniaceae archaeon]